MNRKEIENNNAIYNKAMPWWKNDIYGTELMGMRILRKKSLKEMAKVTGFTVEHLRAIETDRDIPAPPPLAGKYMVYLSCNMNHVYQFREIVEGKTTKFQESRIIGSKLKKDVYKKCNSRCVVCKSTENLHIHHIKEYANGGLNELSNLVLLCASCHAETHKDNRAYWLLKKGADS